MSSTQVQHLANGLQVILKEVQHVPVVSIWMAYRVGSRNEPTGQTGLSHWVEHMLFKGTEQFPAGVLDREIDRSGGTWNAFTTTDYTVYYATVPAHRLDLPLAAEADRMTNALFDPQETEAERSVIISERQGSENSPLFWLMEELRASAFRVHGYHHDILGDMADLEQTERDTLYAHYRRHYVPANACLVAVGAFQSADLMRQIEAHFGAIPSAPAPRLFVRPEPEQQGERRVLVEREGSTAFLSVAYHVPPCTHPDWFALDILDSILTGASEEAESKTCRLYKTLVKSGMAVSVSGELAETMDPYLYTLVITLNDGCPHEEAEEALLAELERIAEDGVSEKELERAKKQAKASFAYNVESVTNMAYWLAQSAMLGDVSWYDHFMERLNAVTREDVQNAVQRYFTPQKRIVAWLIPTGGADEDDEDEDGEDYDE